MSSKAETLKAAALEKGDHSKLCTKNVHGQMFLVLAPELEPTKSDDSSTDTEPESDVEIDYEPFDSSASLMLGLLDENGREVKEVFVKGCPPCSKGSFDALWKKRIIKSEISSHDLGKISSITVPTMPKPPDGLKWLPVTSYKENPFPSAPRNTYIIRTSLPLSSLNLKSLIHSGSISGLVANNPAGKPFNFPGTVAVTDSPTITTVYPPFSSHHTTQALSSSNPSINLVSQKPHTATINSITSPISCVNKTHSSFSNKVLIQRPSASFNTTNTVITSSTYSDKKLVEAVAVPTAGHPSGQSFPRATNVIKPVLDTGQSIPKVQISSPNLLSPVITSDSSQGLTSNVQSKVISSSQIGQLLNIGLASNSNSLQMAPCMLLSTSETGTSSSTLSTAKAPIVHTGLLPQNLASGIKKEMDETPLINNVTSSTLDLRRPMSTSVLAPSNNTATIQKMLQSNTTITSSLSSPLVCIKKTDPTSIPSFSSASPCTFVSIPDPNVPGSILVKIIPTSTSSATSGNTFTLPAGVSSMAGTMNSTICSPSLAGNLDQHGTLSADAAKKLKQNQVCHNITMNISPHAATVNDSATDLEESKTDLSINKSPPVNSIKTVRLMAPSGACSLFSPTVTLSNSITTISNTNSSNENMNANLQKDGPVTKISDSGNAQQDSVIILPTSYTASPVTTTSATVDMKASQKGQEKTNSAKVDDTVQFLKLGSFSNSAKPDVANNDAKLVNGLVEAKENDSNTIDDSSLLNLSAALLKDADSDAVKLNLISDVHKIKQEFNDGNNTADAAKLNLTSAILNLNNKVNNTNMIKIPTSLINGRHVITLPSSATASSSAPGVTLPNLVSSSNTQLLSTTSKPTTSAQVLDSQLPATTQLVTLANKAQNVTLPNQTPAIAQLISLASKNAPQLVTLPNQTPKTTQHVTLASNTQNVPQLVTLASKSQNVPQLVSLLGQTSTTTNVVKLTSPLSSGTQLSTLSTQIPKGSQIFKLATPLPPGTQLSSLPTQIPKGAQFIKLASGTPLSGTQFVTVTSSAQRCSRHATLTTQTLSSPKVATSGTQVSSSTHIVPLINQATTRPQLVPLTAQTPSPIVSLTNQVAETTRVASLVNQGTANQQFVRLPTVAGSHIVKLSSKALSGSHVMKLPNPNNSVTKVAGQILSGTQFVRLNMVNSTTAPYFKLMPITNSPRMQLAHKIICNSMPANSNGQTSTNMSNGKGAIPTINAELFRKLQTGESCAVVVNTKAPLSSLPHTSTTTTTSVSNLPMHSLLLPKGEEQKISSSSALQLPLIPSEKLPIEIDSAEDLPMTLKIDSIFSLKDDKNQALDYWESPQKDKPTKDDQTKTMCGNKVDVTTCKRENVASETEQEDMKLATSPQSRPIVYARLNKPKTNMTSSPTQKKHYKIHDLSNYFPTAQRKPTVEICRPFKTGRWVSIIKKAKRPQAYKIKGRLHVNRVKQQKYAFLQPRVMLPQLYIPARMKSLNISRLPVETIKSLSCEDDCVHRVRVSYTAPVQIKSSSPQTAKKYMVVKFNHNAVLKPYSPNSTPSTTVTKLPVKNISSFNVRITPTVNQSNEVESISIPSMNNDNALSCLELACGIIQDDTLKKRKSLGRRDNDDTDWTDDLEKQYKSKRRKMHSEKVSSSDLTDLAGSNTSM